MVLLACVVLNGCGDDDPIPSPGPDTGNSGTGNGNEPGNGSGNEPSVTPADLAIKSVFPGKRLIKIDALNQDGSFWKVSDEFVYEGDRLVEYRHGRDGDDFFRLEWSVDKITVYRLGTDLPLYEARLGENGCVASVSALRRKSEAVLEYDADLRIKKYVVDWDDTHDETINNWKDGNLEYRTSVRDHGNPEERKYHSFSQKRNVGSAVSYDISPKPYSLSSGIGDGSHYQDALYYAGVLGRPSCNMFDTENPRYTDNKRDYLYESFYIYEFDKDGYVVKSGQKIVITYHSNGKVEEKIYWEYQYTYE